MKIIKSAFFTAVCLGSLAYLQWGYDPDVSVVNIVDKQTHHQTTATGIPFLPVNDIQTFIDSLSTRMKQQHGHEIQDVLVQLSMADFRDFVLEEFPDNGLSVFQQIMKNAFPEYADAIFALLANMRSYNDWHVSMLLTLNLSLIHI